jgi:hypothetical protein
MPETRSVPETHDASDGAALLAQEGRVEPVPDAASAEQPIRFPETIPLEEPAPMLDVHPAYHAATTWRDFFIHIATIVLGLLIAVGLEQTVELVHRRHEAQEARENIRDEIQMNIAILQKDAGVLSATEKDFDRDMELLDSNAPEAQIISQLSYPFRLVKPHEAAWNAAKINGSLALLPQENTFLATNYFYETNDQMHPLEFSYLTAIQSAQALEDHAKAAGKLTPFQRQQLLEETASALGQARALEQLYGFEGKTLQEQGLR